MAKNKKQEEREVTVEEVKRESGENLEAENDACENKTQAPAGEENVNAVLEDLQNKLAESEKKAEEYKASWYRTAADFDNFRKRNSETRANAYADGKGDAIKKMLVIGDNLDRALTTAMDEKTKEGLELVVKQYGEVLTNLGVSVIDPVGETFDPQLHEAVHQVEPTEGDESGKVKQVFKKGYSLDGKMLRYAQVIVIK